MINTSDPPKDTDLLEEDVLRHIETWSFDMRDRRFRIAGARLSQLIERYASVHNHSSVHNYGTRRKLTSFFSRKRKRREEMLLAVLRRLVKQVKIERTEVEVPDPPHKHARHSKRTKIEVYYRAVGLLESLAIVSESTTAV